MFVTPHHPPPPRMLLWRGCEISFNEPTISSITTKKIENIKTLYIENLKLPSLAQHDPMHSRLAELTRRKLIFCPCALFCKILLLPVFSDFYCQCANYSWCRVLDFNQDLVTAFHQIVNFNPINHQHTHSHE